MMGRMSPSPDLLMIPWPFFIGVSVLLGLLLGSFTNVLIYRIPKGLSIVTPRSFCPSCSTPVAALDNIPVLSFLLLTGKCRHCKASISARYPLVEALSGLGYGAVAWAVGPSWGLLPLWGFVTASLALAFIDLDEMILPDAITLPGIVLGIAAGSFLLPLGFAGSLLGAAVGGGILWAVVILSRGGMGGGDVKYMAMAGSLLGWPKTLVALFAAVTLGSVVGVFLLATKRKTRKDPIPFGPFLVLGSLLSLVAGEAVIAWYLGR
jgi:leader peptidase (prepilin peptidase)/N-methyltransferase